MDQNEEDQNSKDPIPFNFELWNKWLSEVVDNIIEEQEGVWIVGANTNQIDLSNKLICFGKNKYGEEIWKIKYFIKDDIHIFYRNHYIAHAKHILEQPKHYRGMFEILN